MKRPEIKALETKAFAKAYIENGYDGKNAMLAIKPDLTPGSAAVAASVALTEPNTVGAIVSYMDGVKNSWKTAMMKAIALTEQELDSDNKIDKKDAKEYLLAAGRVIAQIESGSGVKTAIQNNNYKLPKR